MQISFEDHSHLASFTSICVEMVLPCAKKMRAHSILESWYSICTSDYFVLVNHQNHQNYSKQTGLPNLHAICTLSPISLYKEVGSPRAKVEKVFMMM